MEALEVALKIVSPLIALASMGVSMALYRAAARRKELSSLKEDIDAVESALSQHREAGTVSRSQLSERLAHVEQHLAQLPDRETVHGLAMGQAEMRGDIKAMAERLVSVGATAQRVEEFLLKGKVE